MRKINLLLPVLLLLFSFQAMAQNSNTIDQLRSRLNFIENRESFRLGYKEDVNQSLVFCRMSARNLGTYTESLNTVIGLNIGFDFEGNHFDKRINSFAVFFHSLGRRWVLLKDETLIIKADGQTFNLGKSEKNSEIKKNFLFENLTKESLVFRVDRSVMEKVSSAKTVEVRIRDLYYKLDSKDFENLKNLLQLAEVS